MLIITYLIFMIYYDICCACAMLQCILQTPSAMTLMTMNQLLITNPLGMTTTLADLDTIYANAARTHAGMVPTKCFCQMPDEGQKLWVSLSDADCRLILEQDLASTSTLTNCMGVKNGCRQGTFAQQHDKLHVFLHDQEPIDLASVSHSYRCLNYQPGTLRT